MHVPEPDIMIEPDQAAATLNALHGELWAAVNKLEQYWIEVQHAVTNPEVFRPAASGTRAAFMALEEIRQVDQAADSALGALRRTRDRIDESWEAAENIALMLPGLLANTNVAPVLDLVAEEARDGHPCR